MTTAKNILSQLEYKDRYSYYKNVAFLINEPNLIKFRIFIREDLFLQIYHNDDSGTASFSLVLGEDRIFGRDQEEGVWHRHPLGNPNYHDSGKEGKKSTILKTFFEETDIILKDLALI